MVARENVELTAEPDAEASRVLRLVLARKGDLQGADDAFRLGNALAKEQRLDQAIAWHRKTIELDPKHVKAHNALGNDLYSQKKLDEAIACYRKAIELDPKSVIAWQCLGWVQYRAGNWKASIESLEKSCQLQNPGDRGQWLVMSLAHGKLANEKDQPEGERDRHKTESHRWYDQAANQIDSRVASGDYVGQAIRALRVEAAELLGVKVKPK